MTTRDHASFDNTPATLGWSGAEITPDDDLDISPIPKAVVVAAAGTVLQLLPLGNADGEWLTFANVPVGWVPPYVVRRIGEATTCTVATVDF